MIAYLDANSGSMFISVILGGLAGIAVAIKLGWRRIVGFFSPRARRAANESIAAEAAVPGSDVVGDVK